MDAHMHTHDHIFSRTIAQTSTQTRESAHSFAHANTHAQSRTHSRHIHQYTPRLFNDVNIDPDALGRGNKNLALPEAVCTLRLFISTYDRVWIEYVSIVFTCSSTANWQRRVLTARRALYSV